jgi:hypothetical protein
MFSVSIMGTSQKPSAALASSISLKENQEQQLADTQAPSIALPTSKNKNKKKPKNRKTSPSASYEKISPSN